MKPAARDGRGHPVHRLEMPRPLADGVAAALREVPTWAGSLDEQGRHVIDLKAPAPGPHFFTNVLLGNRIGYPRALQTTPKSVVDHLGRGSFRSHAATQVLATRWDMRPEENGFPANRQFYLVEEGRRVFYSADPQDPNVAWARAVHSQNSTTITYRTKCGLEIERTIFLLPYEEGLPLATEVQSIRLTNHGQSGRTLRLVVTGMFGAASPGGLQQDVMYTTVSMQGRVLRNADCTIAAVSPHYHPAWAYEDARFHAMVVHTGERTCYPTEFGTSYNEFVGQGTLEHPEGLALLSNRLARKGPGFFALAAPLDLPAGCMARADNFTGLVSEQPDDGRGEQLLRPQVERLLARFASADEVDRARAANDDFFDRYRRHMQVRSDEAQFDAFVNRNLPFQVLYQTFVSRSFDQTQKGFREIGFREIQDLFASLPYFIAMGEQEFARDLMKEWARQVFELGYANHNFYWRGKEPGEYSDDALWLVQAVDIYLNLTGDQAFLDEACEIAGTSPARTRTLYETLQAIVRYSGETSIGKHGLPLLDKADWNDTLSVDAGWLDGPAKEATYLRQLEGRAISPTSVEPLESTLSESVMNAFLLKVALDAVRDMAQRRGDTAYTGHLEGLARRLCQNLQDHAWKEDFFARVLFNDGRGRGYLGAGGDKLSADPHLEGTYFLNSCTWSILSNVATEEQIRTMLGVVKRVLATPHGLKLCSPVRFEAITWRGGSAEYYHGDRENGGVFKHADMMAVVALLKAAREVGSRSLATELRDLAYSVIDVVLPYRTLRDPYVLAGNPRFCTQYNNAETGENVGPTLSGTATWMWLALKAAYGLRVTPEEIELDPILRDDQRQLELTLDTGRATYHVRFLKPAGFCRRADERPRVYLDGAAWDSARLPHFQDGGTHEVEVAFPESL